MSLVTESLQNPKMGISFCGKNWIPSLRNKADRLTEVSTSVRTLAELLMVTKRCDDMLAVFPGEHPSYRWMLHEVLFQTSLLFWNVPVRGQNWFLFHCCMDQLKTELLPSWLCEIIFLCGSPLFLCSGRKHKTIVLLTYLYKALLYHSD